MSPLRRLLASLSCEKQVRERLGMAPDHPERITRQPSVRELKVLGGLRQSAWPDSEWIDVIRSEREAGS